MRTMTCAQLGGPCDHPHRGEDANAVIKAQDQHLRERQQAGDATHQQARDAMGARWRHPRRSLDWYRGAQRAFAALPED